MVLPLAYASWLIFSPLLFGYSRLEGYIPISPDYPFQFALLLIIEPIIFVGGVILFLFGLYHFIYIYIKIFYTFSNKKVEIVVTKL